MYSCGCRSSDILWWIRWRWFFSRLDIAESVRTREGEILGTLMIATVDTSGRFDDGLVDFGYGWIYFLPALIWVLVVGSIVWVVFWSIVQSRPPQPKMRRRNSPRHQSVEEMLARKFSQGGMEEREYQYRLSVLRSSSARQRRYRNFL